MNKLNIINSDGYLTDESRKAILKHTQVIECGWPQHLLVVLESIRKFQEYETSCIIRFPKDAEIHSLLFEESKRLEKHATQTLVEFMKKENIVDADLRFCIPRVQMPT